MSVRVCVLVSGGQFLQKAPSRWKPAGTWTPDIMQAQQFQGEFFTKEETDKGVSQVVFYSGWDYHHPITDILNFYRKRVPPSMVPTVKVLDELRIADDQPSTMKEW